jgi:RNA polymerase sigma-70 factor (ECF subfamily)
MSLAVLTLPDSAAPDVSRAARGDRGAFGRLYQRHVRLVHAILLARVPRHAIEDLKQDVFLRAFEQVGSLRNGEAFAAWISSIARHAATDYQRARRPEAELAEGMRVSHPAPPEAWFVLDAIRALPEAYQETLVLRLVEGMTGPEIAAQTGLKPESVRVNLHRGMKLLRERLG